MTVPKMDEFDCFEEDLGYHVIQNCVMGFFDKIDNLAIALVEMGDGASAAANRKAIQAALALSEAMTSLVTGTAGYAKDCIGGAAWDALPVSPEARKAFKNAVDAASGLKAAFDQWNPNSGQPPTDTQTDALEKMKKSYEAFTKSKSAWNDAVAWVTSFEWGDLESQSLSAFEDTRAAMELCRLAEADEALQRAVKKAQQAWFQAAVRRAEAHKLSVCKAEILDARIDYNWRYDPPVNDGIYDDWVAYHREMDALDTTMDQLRVHLEELGAQCGRLQTLAERAESMQENYEEQKARAVAAVKAEPPELDEAKDALDRMKRLEGHPCFDELGLFRSSANIEQLIAQAEGEGSEGPDLEKIVLASVARLGWDPGRVKTNPNPTPRFAYFNTYHPEKFVYPKNYLSIVELETSEAAMERLAKATEKYKGANFFLEPVSAAGEGKASIGRQKWMPGASGWMVVGRYIISVSHQKQEYDETKWVHYEDNVAPLEFEYIPSALLAAGEELRFSLD